jgi:hypothetical protein
MGAKSAFEGVARNATSSAIPLSDQPSRPPHSKNLDSGFGTNCIKKGFGGGKLDASRRAAHSCSQLPRGKEASPKRR